MVSVTFTSPEEKWLLKLTLGLKGISSSAWRQAKETSISLPGCQVRGATACLLVLECLAPNPSLFPNGNMGMPVALLHWQRSMAQVSMSAMDCILANAELIGRQLHDGRAFLQGDQPGLADIASASWLLSKNKQLSEGHKLAPWLKRMAEIGDAGGSKQPSVETLDFQPLVQQGLLQTELKDNIQFVSSPLDP